jgi:hypothetical protein
MMPLLMIIRSTCIKMIMNLRLLSGIVNTLRDCLYCVQVFKQMLVENRLSRDSKIRGQYSWNKLGKMQGAN